MGKRENTFELEDQSTSKLKRRAFTLLVTERLDETLENIVEEVQIDVKADFVIGPDLMKELADSPGILAWYTQLKEQAHAMMKKARYREHSLREDMYNEIKSANARMSETAIRTQIYQTSKMRKRVERYMLWATRYRQLHELCEAWKVRNENLRSMETSMRRDR